MSKRNGATHAQCCDHVAGANFGIPTPEGTIVGGAVTCCRCGPQRVQFILPSKEMLDAFKAEKHGPFVEFVLGVTAPAKPSGGLIVPGPGDIPRIGRA